MRLCEQLGSLANEELVIRASKGPLVHQTPPAPAEKAVPAQATPERLPRITKLLALAVRFEDLLRNGTAKDYADLARLGGVSPSRITQVMNLRHLAPPLQEKILSMELYSQDRLNERALRRIGTIVDWREQLKAFERISARQRLVPTT